MRTIKQWWTKRNRRACRRCGSYGKNLVDTSTFLCISCRMDLG
jgi:anaerobic ribonucleoside-triphosphate reductase